MGNETFYGSNGSVIDTTKKMTVITQFSESPLIQFTDISTWEFSETTDELLEIGIFSA